MLFFLFIYASCTLYKLTSPITYSSFGTSVSIDGDTLIVGAKNLESFYGHAYIFSKSGDDWIQKAHFEGEQIYDLFGDVVAISGNHAIVAAPMFDYEEYTNAGCLYAYHKVNSTWHFQQKITNPNPSNNLKFGASFSIHGNYLIVGIEESDEHGPGYGDVIVFFWNEIHWINHNHFLPSDVHEDMYFGREVAMSNNHAIVSSQLNNTIYVFRKTGSSWVEEAKFELHSQISFGSVLDIHENYFVTSDTHDESNNVTASGAIYIFYKDGTEWIQHTKILPSDPGENDRFGNDVAIFGDYIIVGVPRDDSNLTDSGSAYLFKRNSSNWVEVTKFTVERKAYDFFGHSIDISDRHAVIGAPDGEYGHVYIYTLDVDEDYDQYAMVYFKKLRHQYFILILSISMTIVGVVLLTVILAFLCDALWLRIKR